MNKILPCSTSVVARDGIPWPISATFDFRVMHWPFYSWASALDVPSVLSWPFYSFGFCSRHSKCFRSRFMYSAKGVPKF